MKITDIPAIGEPPTSLWPLMHSIETASFLPALHPRVPPDPPLCAPFPSTPIQDPPGTQAGSSFSKATPWDTCRMQTVPAIQHDAQPSPILPQHIQDLKRWGIIERMDPKPRSFAGQLFLTPKADGLQSRALFDARRQNATLDWCRLSLHGRFRLLRPYHQILVGLATQASNPRIAEISGAVLLFGSWFHPRVSA